MQNILTDSISMAHAYRSVQAQLQTSSPSVGYLDVQCILQSQTFTATAIPTRHGVMEVTTWQRKKIMASKPQL